MLISLYVFLEVYLFFSLYIHIYIHIYMYIKFQIEPKEKLKSHSSNKIMSKQNTQDLYELEVKHSYNTPSIIKIHNRCTLIYQNKN